MMHLNGVLALLDHLDEIFTVESLRNKFSNSITAKQLIDEFPNDFSSSCIVESFVAILGGTMEDVMDDIKKEAGDNEADVARILRGVYVGIYNSRKEDGLPITSVYPSYHDYKDEKTTIIEYNLSFAMWSCNRSIYQLRNFDLEDAFHWLGQAKVCIGTASGLRSSTDQNKLKKKLKDDFAAAIRHSESRSIKASIIQEYIDNYAVKLVGLGLREASKIKNKAAEELANKYEVEYRTVRNDYIDQYHRENTPS